MRVEAGSNQSESSLKLRSRDKEGSRLTSGLDSIEVMGGGSDDEDKGKGNRSGFFAGRMSDPTDIEMGDAGLNTWSSPAGGEWDAPRDPDEEAKHLLSSSGDDSMGVGIMKQTALTRFFQASWPSQLCRFMFWARPGMDIWVWLGILVFCFLTGEPREADSSIWRTLRGNTWLFLWLPFWYRFCTGLLHFLMSLAILPGPILYHEGPLLRLYPKWALDMISESFAMRQLNRPRLVAAGGIPVVLQAPDGCTIDALYFRGDGNAKIDGPTVIRFNGNAEAIELQDEILPKIYTNAGVNFIMYNYRGIGRCRYPKIFHNELANYLIGMNRVPAREGMILDAWTVVEYVTKELGVPCSKLCLVGHSIGGAVATQLCASQPSLKVSLCNTRSFASLSKVVVQLAPAFLGIPPASKKGRALRILARGAMIVTGWEYNSFNNWQKVQGFKWLEFSSADHIIPHELSLHAAVTAQEKLLGTEGEAKTRIFPLVNLSGMDNHNRMWLDTEMVQHVDYVAEACGLDAMESPTDRELARKKREEDLYELLASFHG